MATAGRSVTETMKDIVAEATRLEEERSLQMRRLDAELTALNRAKVNIDAQIKALEVYRKKGFRPSPMAQAKRLSEAQAAFFSVMKHQQTQLSDIAERKGRIAVDIVVALDPFEVDRVAVIVVLPVSGSLVTAMEPGCRSDEQELADRVKQGLHAATQGRWRAATRIEAGAHEGLMVLELDVTHEGDVQAFTKHLLKQLSKVTAGAGALRKSGIVAESILVDLEFLLPDPNVQMEVSHG
jgi:hypothetical protein